MKSSRLPVFRWRSLGTRLLLSRGEITKGEGGRREGKRRVGGTVWFSPRALKVGKELLILQTGKWLDIGLVPNFF